MIAIALVVAPAWAIRRATRERDFPRSARRCASAILAVYALSSIFVVISDPAEWLGRHPVASDLARIFSLPVMAIGGLVFWLVGFRLVPSAYRSGLKAVLVVVGSTITRFLLVLAVFHLCGAF
jgi:hypothetical protein